MSHDKKLEGNISEFVNKMTLSQKRNAAVFFYEHKHIPENTILHLTLLSRIIAVQIVNLNNYSDCNCWSCFLGNELKTLLA